MNLTRYMSWAETAYPVGAQVTGGKTRENANKKVAGRIIPPVAATPSAPGPAFSSSTATNRATSVPSRSEPARAPGHFPSPVSTSSLRTHRALFVVTARPIFPVHVFRLFR